MSRHAERVGRRGELKVEHALVLRRVGIALLHDVVAPREIAVELAARAGCAGNDQSAVPVVGQPQQEARLAGRIRCDARLDLQPGHDFVIGVRLGASARSRRDRFCGVNANAGRPGIELLAGVVSGLAVVRSGLWTQVASASRLPRAFRTWAQVGAACTQKGMSSESASAPDQADAPRTNRRLDGRKFVKRFIRVPLCVADEKEWIPETNLPVPIFYAKPVACSAAAPGSRRRAVNA